MNWLGFRVCGIKVRVTARSNTWLIIAGVEASTIHINALHHYMGPSFASSGSLAPIYPRGH